MAISSVIAALQVMAGTAIGKSGLPTHPPESINQLPFAITYLDHGDWVTQTAGMKKGLHTFVTELHYARMILPKDIAACIDIGETFANQVLGDPKLSATVDTVVGAIRYRYVTFNPDKEDQHIGWRFEIDVKIQNGTS
jgi:hypothetical protein